MHHEYAVEPAAIGSSWETFRYLFEKFGFQEGRLISRFPSKWERQVIEAAKAAGVPDMAQKRIVNQLQQRKRTAIIETGRAYRPELESWVVNALVSDKVKPFRAIVAQEANAGKEIVTPDELDADHPLMATPRSRDVPRTPVDIAAACSLLLRSAREVDLVDPFFDLRNHAGNYRDPLKLMLRELEATVNENICVRIHYRFHRTRPTESEVLRGAGGWVNGIIPQNCELHLYSWRERANGEDIHDRYLLCDCGGLMIGAGFAASTRQENAAFTLLDETHVQELRSRFSNRSNVYRQVGRAVRIKANGDTDLV